MSFEKQRLGMQGEEIAARHLEASGYRIIARRYRTRLGEIDLVATIGGLLVFFEVKLRRDTRLGTPGEAVHYPKQARIARAAGLFLIERGYLDLPCRFDVIAITWPGLRSEGGPHLEHIQDAFRPLG